MRKFVPVLVAFLVVGLAGSAFAEKKLKVEPWIFDPDGLGDVEAAWIDGIGLSDKEAKDANKGKEPKDKKAKKNKKHFHGLYLAKDAETSSFQAAGAFINFEGTLTELGFDVRNGTYCGAGAPRFNVYTSDDQVYYFYGCLSGVHEPVEDEPGWTRVRFAAADGFPSDGVSFITSFDEIEVVGIDIVFDEGPGFVILDNIDINGTLIGGP